MRGGAVFGDLLLSTGPTITRLRVGVGRYVYFYERYEIFSRNAIGSRRIGERHRDSLTNETRNVALHVVRMMYVVCLRVYVQLTVDS